MTTTAPVTPVTPIDSLDSAPYNDLRAQLATAQAELVRTRAELGACQRRWVMVKQIVGNAGITDADARIALAGIVVYERKAGVNVVKTAAAGDALPTVPVYRVELARAAGKSEQAIGDGLKRQAKLGAATVNTTYSKDAGGIPMPQLHYAPTAALITKPARLKYDEADKPAKWGGKREKCPGCGSEHIIERRSWYCADCGELVKAFEDHPVNAPDLHPVELVTEPAPAPEPEPIAQAPETGNLTCAVHLDSQAEPHDQEMACGHSPASLRRIKGKWVCGQCPAPDKPVRNGVACHDCELVIPQYAAHAVWSEGVPLLVCEGCKAKRAEGSAA